MQNEYVKPLTIRNSPKQTESSQFGTVRDFGISVIVKLLTDWSDT